MAEPPTPQAAAGGEVRFGAFRFDLGQNILWRGEVPVRLTEAEASLMRAFALAPGVTFSREDLVDGNARSEEHTSELQSLMRISYAVFCLKKKKRKVHVLP